MLNKYKQLYTFLKRNLEFFVSATISLIILIFLIFFTVNHQIVDVSDSITNNNIFIEHLIEVFDEHYKRLQNNNNNNQKAYVQIISDIGNGGLTLIGNHPFLYFGAEALLVKLPYLIEQSNDSIVYYNNCLAANEKILSVLYSDFRILYKFLESISAKPNTDFIDFRNLLAPIQLHSSIFSTLNTSIYEIIMKYYTPENGFDIERKFPVQLRAADYKWMQRAPDGSCFITERIVGKLPSEKIRGYREAQCNIMDVYEQETGYTNYIITYPEYIPDGSEPWLVLPSIKRIAENENPGVRIEKGALKGLLRYMTEEVIGVEIHKKEEENEEFIALREGVRSTFANLHYFLSPKAVAFMSSFVICSLWCFKKYAQIMNLSTTV